MAGYRLRRSEILHRGNVLHIQVHGIGGIRKHSVDIDLHFRLAAERGRARRVKMPCQGATARALFRLVQTIIPGNVEPLETCGQQPTVDVGNVWASAIKENTSIKTRITDFLIESSFDKSRYLITGL